MAVVDPLILLTLFAILLFVIGVPILLVFGAWTVGFTYLVDLFQFLNLPLVAYNQLDSYPLVAVPLFIVIGTLISEFQISDDIIAFARSLIGWLPGSTANTSLLMAGIFAAITGSNSATTAAVGEALYDDLEAEEYEPRFAAATIASGGTLGIIIPPSILFILYGALFNVSIADLFLAGIIPGILMLGGLTAVATVQSYRHGYGRERTPFSPTDVVRQAWRAKYALLAIVILLGGIYSGTFTPTESAAVATGYILLVGLVTARFTEFNQLLRGMTTAITIQGIIIPIYVASVMIQQNLSFLGLQRAIADAIQALGSPWLVGAAMVVVMLLSGSFLASVPNMILIAPLLAPIAATLGLSPVMWGVVFMMSDAIGFITPPYGLNLYIISSLTGIDYIRVALAAVPYLAVLVVIWLTFFIFPELNVLVG
ncbi:TRAP transporter large permease [Haloglomus litoreum]|uniref:TRAP transporter large permease n=1 Tax=Haloglomus litoreum TaxID=3034026 RepID=UPI0023E8551B|nr:TRAP transporter large permease [Haloglomus sp. DT116]